MSSLLKQDHWHVPPSHLADAFSPDELADAVTELAGRMSSDRALEEAFTHEVAMRSGRMSSVFLAPGSTTDSLALDVLDQVEDPDVRLRCLRSVVLSDSPLLPLDLRTSALARHDAAGGSRAALQQAWATTRTPDDEVPAAVDLLHRDSDGIDHTFDVPVEVGRFATLLFSAARVYQAHRVTALLARVPEPRVPDVPLHPLAAEIAADLTGTELVPDDFLVPWDLPVATGPDGEPLTIAEVAKALLLHPAARLPLRDLRVATVAFYRSVFGVGGRSVVGLGSGFLYVEHGSRADPSYVYVGQGAIVGKGVTVDTVGGVALGRESFIGGGFIPLLIHTHKHIRAQGGTAATERLTIQTTAFVAEAGARLPLGVLGLLECADHVGDPLPYPGIKVVPTDIAPAKES